MRTSLKQLICGLLILLPFSAYAGFGNLDIGAGEINKGSAGVGVAMPQDSLAAAINPASMSFVPSSRADIGITVVHPPRGYKASGSPFSPPPGFGVPILPGDYDSGDNAIPNPSLGYLQHIKDSPLTYSIAMAGAGWSTDYDEAVFNSGHAGAQYMQYLTNLAASWKVNDKLALGGSFIIAAQTLSIDGISSFAPLSNDPNNLSDRGTNFSYGAGVKIGFMARPIEKVSIGAAYQPEIAMTKMHKYSGTLPNDGAMNIPPTATAGIAVQITPTLKAGFDTQYIWYSAVPAYSNNFKCGTGNLMSGTTCLGTANGTGFGWRNVAAYKLGAVWNALPTWIFRAGYLYATQPIRSSQILLATLAPTTVQNHFTLGVSHIIKQRFQLSAMALYGLKEDVSGYNTFAPDQKITVHMQDFEFGVALGYLFGKPATT
ncbi:MAG: hypothetical protein GY821_10515 [Gammaproteobacteria bacterium]|nr:hypothetical protein [Gammaproteobacteria bacterium]